MNHVTLSMSLAASMWATSALSQAPSSATSPEPHSDNPQVTAPDGAQSVGILTSILGEISLREYGETLVGGALRAREVVLSPGAKIASHAHDERPALVYVLEGELVAHRNDSDTPLIRRRGDTYFEGPGVVHWLENVSRDPVRAFSVDILPSSQE